MKRKRPVGFLNVDLDIMSYKSLDVLADELGRPLLVLHFGKGKRSKNLLMLEGKSTTETADAAAMELCKAVERVSAKARKEWDRAERREFNVGYELKDGMKRMEVVLASKTLRRIVVLGATVGFTCYRTA